MTDKKSILLNRDISLTLEEYESIKGEFIPLLSYGEALLEDRLIAGAVWLDILGDFIRAATPVSGADNSVRKEAFETFFASMINQKYERPFRIARKSLRGNALKRMFLCLLLALRQDDSKRRSNPGMLFFILRQYIKGYLYSGSVRMTPLINDTPLRVFKKIKMDPENEMWSQIILEWLVHFIMTDRLLKTESVQKGYLYILLFYAIAKWCCIAHAFSKNSVEPDPEDILNSIRLVEEHYIFHPWFDEMDATNPIFKDILEGLFKRKSAPMILVRG
ncbi:hypothetical protein JW926_16220 [Candidatus Sumerlaeota bacterium]|nr:hypothetical protein [Candidatus Sumerlaeota bacterium]